MGHSERVGESVAKNVPGVKDQQLFAAGVAYYK
jgi:phosphoribosylformylglycinamidine synthase